MQARSTKRVKVRIRSRGTLIALTLALIAASVPATAVAAPATSSLKVAQSRSSVLNYWTDARLENARPADEKVPASSLQPHTMTSGSGAPGTPQLFEGTPAPSNGNQRATPHATVPTEGKIFFTGSDGFDYMCSGTAVISDNESTVWTAGHCVHGGGPGQDFHSNWVFIPAYDDGETPYGVWTAAWLNTPTPWALFGSLKYDVGAAVVNTNEGTTLGDTVGMAGIAFNQPAAQRWTSLGYPAGPPWDGGNLISCDSRTLGRHNPDPVRGQRTMYINCNMNGGSSGGGWFMTSGSESYVGSVNSYGIRGHRNLMFGPYHGNAALELYRSMQGL